MKKDKLAKKLAKYWHRNQKYGELPYDYHLKHCFEIAKKKTIINGIQKKLERILSAQFGYTMQ